MSDRRLVRATMVGHYYITRKDLAAHYGTEDFDEALKIDQENCADILTTYGITDESLPESVVLEFAPDRDSCFLCSHPECSCAQVPEA